MITEAQASEMVEATRAVAKSEILSRFRRLSADDALRKSHADDLVTEADRAAEVALTAAFRDILPGATVIGEEAISEDKSLLGRLSDDRVVIIDPIDGTWNYAQGIGTFGVIVAVLEKGETVWGCLYDPLGDDWITAHKSGGAWFGRTGESRPLTLGTRPQAFGEVAASMHINLYPQAAREALWPLAAQLRRFTHLGASCHDYRVMALGGIDLMLNYMLNPWDHAAGALILSEMGGVLRLLDGRGYAPTMTEGRLLVATSEALWEDAAGRIKI